MTRDARAEREHQEAVMLFNAVAAHRSGKKSPLVRKLLAPLQICHATGFIQVFDK